MQHIRLAVGIALLAPLASEAGAWAHKNGIVAEGCDGCHNGGQPATVTLVASPENPAVGQAVTLTITVSQTNGPAAGFYLTTQPPAGMFKSIEAGTAASSLGVTHTTPRVGSGGVTTFQAQWSASQPTGAQFFVYALSANNDGTSQGDGAGQASLSITSGCAGTGYYMDQDGDGFGTADPLFPVRRECAQPMGYSAVSGDCNDFDATVRPGAPEICDGKDNNCDGRVDENLPVVTYCQDKDGDGHGVPGGATQMGCAPKAGFGDCAGDCNDANPMVYPGAMELCDGIDNNCNGQIDEGARSTCGLGWCRRYAIGCTSQCTPGPPRVEVCNAFDDDCDGVIDNGTDLELCGAPGLKCLAGSCVPAGANPGSAGGRGMTGDVLAGDAAADRAADTTVAAQGGCAIGRGRPNVLFALVQIGLLGLALRPRRRNLG